MKTGMDYIKEERRSQIEDHGYTVDCHVSNSPISSWKKSEFLEGFGKNRIHVSDHIISGKG